MPSVFDSQFKQSGFPMLAEYFGEPVVYCFKKGGERHVNAIIERTPPARYDIAGNVYQPAFNIRLKASCTEGVTATEVDTGGDYVRLPEHPDGVPLKTCTVMKLLSQDSGVIVLELQ